MGRRGRKEVNEKCSQCGADINDQTRDCGSCGHRVYEERLWRRLMMFESAFAGWQQQLNQFNQLQTKIVGEAEIVNKDENTEEKDNDKE